MSYPVIEAPAGSTVYIPFATYAGATGASLACSGLAVTDVEIYKNGSTTQRSSDAGVALLDTDGIDFDSLVGINGFSIDLSDNTDSGFYAAGSWYWVVVSSITVDAQTVNFIAAMIRIVAAETTAGTPNVTSAALGTQAKADVNAEVLDVLNVDTFSEPSSVPAATSSLRAKLGWLFSLARNKVTQTGTVQTLRNDADSGNIGTAATADSAGVYTRSEWS